MSDKNSLSKILSVKFNDITNCAGASLSEIISYFKTFDQANISEAFDATSHKNKVITANKWSAFTKKVYNLQVESKSGFKNLIKYLDDEKKSNKLIGKPTGESINFLYLKKAIKYYNEKKYKPAYNLFRHLTCEESEKDTGKEATQIYGISIYYIALCNLNGNGTDKDENYALSVAKFLEQYKKNSEALKVYNLLCSEAKDVNIKKEALLEINKLQIKK
ncbi:1339_t:CDS:1 [Dentiscutata erythropus]|uniref:1339_t:CDS:1 n=1 Tax=Dentiscutata erythropus TaxID=1348616 RepID=A0A9N8VU11_9GLOM|nr:1339_t:CDS:1 [Dentiscutata erythropus]